MRNTITILLVFYTLCSFAQTRKYSTFYEQRASHFEQLPISTLDIVFVGNSITNGGEWHEIFNNKNIKNRGISGDIAEGLYDRLGAILEGEPHKIFLMIGINDIARNNSIDSIVFHIEKSISKIHKESPNTTIYLQSVLPVNPDFGMFSQHMKPDMIIKLNTELEKLADRSSSVYINLYSHFVIDGTTKMKPEYTNDGLHLLGTGYQKWGEILSSYIDNKKQSDMTNNSICTTLPNFPIMGGVSAPFTGIHNDKLIVAGGCNFPNKLASEGGEKVFYNDVYFLDLSQDNSKWQKSTSLPYAIAYGAYVVVGDGIVCIGGQNQKGASNRVVHLSFDEKKGEVSTKEMPSLPVKLFNADAVVINNTIYVAGGSSSASSNILYMLNLNNLKSGWIQVETNLNEERQQPVVFSQFGELFLGGGYDVKKAKAFTNILKFDFTTNQWNVFSDILQDGQLETFVGTACVNSYSQTLFIGGVNYNLFSQALQRIKQKQEAIEECNDALVEELTKARKDYMNHESDWYKFSPNLMCFDNRTKSWQSLAHYPQLARAGAGIAINENEVYVICGEVKPGIRTEEVSKIIIK